MTDRLSDADLAEMNEIARVIWETSRADEGTISATGANIIADKLLAIGFSKNGAPRLAAEVKALRAENERLHRRLYPGQGESYANEVERQRSIIDTLTVAVHKLTEDRDRLRALLDPDNEEAVEIVTMRVHLAMGCSNGCSDPPTRGERFIAETILTALRVAATKAGDNG